MSLFPPAFLSPGSGEVLLILLALLLLFGPREAPRILRRFQNQLRRLRQATADFQRTLMNSDRPPPRDSSRDTQVYDSARTSSPSAPATPPPPDGSAP